MKHNRLTSCAAANGFAVAGLKLLRPFPRASRQPKPIRPMKTQRVAVALTMINLAILALILVRLRPAVAEQGIPQVLRGHSLEIVDAQGRVRSQIIVTQPTTMPDGKSYP